MSKLLPFFFGALIILLLSTIGLRFEKGEDTWTCEKGEWVEKGNPLAPKPGTACGNILVTSPIDGDTIAQPLLIRGEARVFENQLNYRLKDADASILAEGIITANAPDAGEFGDFEVITFYERPKGKTGTLEVFDYSAKDGSEIDKVTISLRFGEFELTTVKVYFASKNAEEGMECQADFFVTRLVPKTAAIGRAALEELLKGPTEEEKNQGFITSINEGVKIQKLTIVEGIALVDFNLRLEEAVGGSCRVATIRSQITNTLKQFPTVKEVIISINGRIEDILQP